MTVRGHGHEHWRVMCTFLGFASGSYDRIVYTFRIFITLDYENIFLIFLQKTKAYTQDKTHAESKELKRKWGKVDLTVIRLSTASWGMRSGLRPCEVPPCEYSVCGMPIRAATRGWQSPNLSQQVVMLARRVMCASAGWECSPPAPRSARGTVGRFEYLTRRSAVFKIFAITKPYLPYPYHCMPASL